MKITTVKNIVVPFKTYALPRTTIWGEITVSLVKYAGHCFDTRKKCEYCHGADTPNPNKTVRMTCFDHSFGHRTEVCKKCLKNIPKRFGSTFEVDGE